MNTEQKISLANLAEATKQQVFDQVAEHLLRQGMRSRLPNTYACAYRGEDGARCAAGCLISDEEYAKIGQRIEGDGWFSLALDEVVPPRHQSLIIRLQNVHDNFAPHRWPEVLLSAAEDFELDDSHMLRVAREVKA